MGVIKIGLIALVGWMIITTLNPDIAEGARSMMTPHTAFRVVLLGIVIGLFVVTGRQRRS